MLPMKLNTAANKMILFFNYFSLSLIVICYLLKTSAELEMEEPGGVLAVYDFSVKPVTKVETNQPDSGKYQTNTKTDGPSQIKRVGLLKGAPDISCLTKSNQVYRNRVQRE